MYDIIEVALSNPPDKPQTPTGKKNGKISQPYSYTTKTIDPEGDQVYYMWDWGDGNNSGWLGPYNSGVTCYAKHIWNVKGSYSIKVKAKDIYSVKSDWSDPLKVGMPRTKITDNNFIDGLSERFPILFDLFDRFTNMFPILQKLLNRLGQ